MRRKLPVDVVATMRLPRDPAKSLKLDLADLTWAAHGIESGWKASPALLDLLEIARVVHEFDRRQPKRTTGVRAKQVRVSMPVRAVSLWTKSAKEDLTALLRIQGNCDWVFDFVARRKNTSADQLFANTKTVPQVPASSPAIDSVVLFSGGLDSTSGLATLAGAENRTLLVSYYSQNRAKQLGIAEKLKFKRIVQVRSDWQVSGAVNRVGGQFMYRSFLFLAIAAIFAKAVQAKSLLQFENGPLAWAVQPLDLYRITRHAHPLVHHHFAALIKHLTGQTVAVTNPFLTKTKGEAANLLKKAVSGATFKEVVGKTETCWYLNSKIVVAGPVLKQNGVACGACIPCLVRRAALGDQDSPSALNFRTNRRRAERDPVVRVHYEAYSAFVERLLDRSLDVHDFMEEVPAATREALRNGIGGMSAQDAFSLYRRFAKEWVRSFG